MYTGTSNTGRLEKNFTELGHYKIINTLSEQHWYCNGIELGSDTKTFDKFYFDFLSLTSVAESRKIKYANFIIYSI